MKLEVAKQIELPAHCLDLDLDDAGALFASCYDGSVHKIDPDKGTTTALAKCDNIASGIQWCAGAASLIATDYDGRLHWIDPHGRRIERSYRAHGFWSWQSARDPIGKRIASCTGQYLAGGYKYEPAPERQPCVKVLDALTGDTLREFPHVPPVQSIAFSNGGTHLAAGNLMGEVRIWNLESGAEVGRIETGSFTGWGIIKGHYYTGGVFSLAFAPDDQSIYLAGMGTTRDPAAGNGKQLWEQWSWQGGRVEKRAVARDGEIGQGLMESLGFAPSGTLFAMAGRLFKGDWNVALFDTAGGARLAHANCKMRVSKVLWSARGDRLYLAGGVSQGQSIKDLETKPWGRLKVLRVG